MPLEPTPYRKLSNDAHKKLDEIVLTEIAWLVGGPNAVPLPPTLLRTIVVHGPQYLDHDPSKLQSKYSAHKDEFDDLLLDCWKTKSFARVRNLGAPPYHVARGNLSWLFVSAILQATPHAAIGDYSVAQVDISREEQCTSLIYGNMSSHYLTTAFLLYRERYAEHCLCT